MGYRASDARDLLNALGSANITLPSIEQRLVLQLKSSESRESDARTIEAILRDYRDDSVRYAEQFEQQANAAAPNIAEMHRRQSQGFRNTVQRTEALLERLACNPDWA